MTHTLVTILGARRGGRDAGYPKATYRFPNGDEHQTAFFGLALARYLEPDEIVILGTAGSMWSVLVESLADDDKNEEARIGLMDAEDAEAVDQPMLNDVAPLMRRAIGPVVRPTLIPHARDEPEQYEILKAVDAAVAKKGKLDFDLTHGFRHVGMVGFLSSFMLERLRGNQGGRSDAEPGFTLCGLWYGAYDMRQGDIAPVLRLDGLKRVRRWLDALDTFDATGNYGVFADLLREDDVPDDMASRLEAAAFFERTSNVQDAAKEIATFSRDLETSLPGASGLFQDRLAAHLRWAKADRLSEQQRQLARRYLARGDYVRTAIFGMEACVSQECEKRGVSTLEFGNEREQAKSALEKELKKERGTRARAYWDLRDIRNALAHGSPPQAQRIKDALKDPQSLKQELKRALQRFFSGDDAPTPPTAYHRELQGMRERLREERNQK